MIFGKVDATAIRYLCAAIWITIYWMNTHDRRISLESVWRGTVRATLASTVVTLVWLAR